MVARNTLDGALNDRTTGASVLPNEMQDARGIGLMAKLRLVLRRDATQ